MSSREFLRRLLECFKLTFATFKYRNPEKWPYTRFAKDGTRVIFHRLPGIPQEIDLTRYLIYDHLFDLSKPLDWQFTEQQSVQ